VKNKGFNPKTQITNVHVTDEDIVEVFGESQVLRTINLNLDPNTRLKLLCLYSQCYGITNNEFYLWFVKGYIVQEKGINVNCAKATTFTTIEKLKREEIAKWKQIHGLSMSHNTSGDVSLASGIQNVGVTQHVKVHMKQELGVLFK
jgi:hypothetical protein